MRAYLLALSVTASKALQIVNPQTAKLPITNARATGPPAAAFIDPISTGPANVNEAPAGDLWTLLKQVHRNEQGAVSIETILIIAAIALPILIFIIKFGWPRIRKFFNEGMDELEGGALDAAGE